VKFQGLAVLSIFSTIVLPNTALAQLRTFRYNPEKLVGTRILSIARLDSFNYHNNLYEYAVAKTNKGKIPIIFKQEQTLIFHLVFVNPFGGTTSLSKGIPTPVADAFSVMLLKKTNL
jgi:hypothetical protein